MLHLLENRMRQPVMIDIPRQEQHGQTIRMRHRRRGHHVGRAGADRGCRDADAPAAIGLGIGGRGKAHGLFILSPPGRQRVARFVKRFAQAGHIAMAEYREDAAKQVLLAAVHRDPLCRKMPDESLRHRQR